MRLNKFLVVSLDRIGDTVRSTFIYRAIKKHYPRSYVAVLTSSPSDEILNNNAYIDKVFVMPHIELRQLMSDGRKIPEVVFRLYHFLENIKMHEFDVMINPYSEFGAIITRYIKPRYLLGRGMDNRLGFIVQGECSASFTYLMNNGKGARPEKEETFAEFYATILKDIGIELSYEELYPEIRIPKYCESYADRFFSDNGINSEKPVIGIQMGAFSKERAWNPENFVKLAKMVVNEFEAALVFNGSSYEAKTVIKDAVNEIGNNCYVLAGKSSLIEAVAVIKRCSLFVSNDTGPMHIAAALGVPIVAVFGLKGTIPGEAKPWGDMHKVVVAPDVNDIKVDLVFDQVVSILGKVASC